LVQAFTTLVAVVAVGLRHIAVVMAVAVLVQLLAAVLVLQEQ
jgi:hypothetical protein